VRVRVRVRARVRVRVTRLAREGRAGHPLEDASHRAPAQTPARRADARLAPPAARRLGQDLRAELRAERAPPHISPISPHISPISPHISPISPYISPISPYISPISPHISPVSRRDLRAELRAREVKQVGAQPLLVRVRVRVSVRLGLGLGLGLGIGLGLDLGLGLGLGLGLANRLRLVRHGGHPPLLARAVLLR